MSKRFAVVDIETTGGLFKRDRITEVGIVITDGNQIINEYQSLVRPGISIPPFVTKITGITDQMVADAPPFYEIAKDIVQITEGCIFVAHNVRFDYSFIREAFAQLGYAYNRKRMCTVQMSRRLLGLKSHSLESLIKHYDIPVEARHRALDDAKATAFILHQLLNLDNSGEVINKQVNRGVRESLLPTNITLEDLHGLPEETGVYYFLDRTGQIIYVGKSTNIQKRIMQHFSKTTRKAEKLQQRAHIIDIEITGSELVSLIEEGKAIKKHRPELNKAQRNSQFNHAITYTYNSLGYLRFDHKRKWNNKDNVLSTYSGMRAARSVLNHIVEEFELCPMYAGLEIGMGPCSLHQFDRCRGACIHEEAVGLYNERSKLALDLVSNYFEKDFVIVDQGRNPQEKTLILIYNGKYFGHGYVDLDQRVTNLEDCKSLITEQPFFPEYNSFIRNYMAKGKGEEILYF